MTGWTLQAMRQWAAQAPVETVVLAEVDSTSAWLKRTRPHAPRLVITHAQTGGYGQQGRRWYMRPGRDLAFSLWLPWPAARPLPLALTPWLAFHLRGAIQRRSPQPLQHKWPNDLYAPAGKVSGTLVERTEAGLIIGTGINWWGQPEQGASLRAPEPPWAFMNEWIAWLVAAVPAFSPSDWQTVLPGWADHDRFQARQPVRLSDGREAVYLGPDSEGRLQLWLDGRLQRLTSGQVSVVEPVGQPGSQLRPQGEDAQHEQL